MRNRFAMAANVLAFVVAAAGGCASSGSTAAGGSAASVSTGPTFPITVIVDNNLQQIQGVTAYIVQGNGGRKTLGPVESNRKKTFTYEGNATTYYLTARAAARDPEMVSDKIQVTGPTTITWHLASNTIVQGQ